MSCTQSESDVSAVSDTSVPTLLPGENIYEMIGRLHNEGLDYVYERYFGRGATKTSSISSIDGFIDDVIGSGVVNDFLKSKGLSEEVNPITKAQAQQTAVSFATLAEEKNCQYCYELDSLLKYSEGPAEFQKSVKVFIEKVSSVDFQDVANKEALLAGAYVLSASTEYWNNNLEKWMEAISLQLVDSKLITKRISFALRVIDKRGNGIGSATVYADGQFASITSPTGYVYDYPFSVGQTIIVTCDGYEPAIETYSGLNMAIQMKKDNSGLWKDVVACALTDGVTAYGSSAGAVAGLPGLASIAGTSLVASLLAALGMVEN